MPTARWPARQAFGQAQTFRYYLVHVDGGRGRCPKEAPPLGLIPGLSESCLLLPRCPQAQRRLQPQSPLPQKPQGSSTQHSESDQLQCKVWSCLWITTQPGASEFPFSLPQFPHLQNGPVTDPLQGSVHVYIFTAEEGLNISKVFYDGAGCFLQYSRGTWH